MKTREETGSSVNKMAAKPTKRIKLHSELDGASALVPKDPGFKDITLHIVPKKLSKSRVEFLNNLARKKGFTVADSFSDNVTHVVANYDSLDKVLNCLQREHLDHVEVVKLSWLTDCTTQCKVLPVTDEVRLSPAFKSDTHLLDQASQRPIPQNVFREPVENPASLSEGQSNHQDTKYECQRATPLDHPNKKFTDALELLERNSVYADSGQRDTRALAFRRASCALKSYARQLTSIDEASKLSNIGSHSKRVIQDILDKGFSDEVQEIKSSEFFQKMELFSSVYGCGPVTARKWIDMSLCTIADVKKGLADGSMKLTEQQRQGLKYHDDLINPVPKAEANRIRDIVTRELETVLMGCSAHLVGGYRRNKPSGHDVDILITHLDEHKTRGLLVKLVAKLEKLGHIVHKDMAVGQNLKSDQERSDRHKTSALKPGEAMDRLDHCFCIFRTVTSLDSERANSAQETSGENEGSGIAAPASSHNRTQQVRRVDLIVCPPTQFATALLGWTGSKHFNRSLRLYAWKELKMKVSNHGIWDHHYSPPRQLHATNEKEIFELLQLPYREPWERNC